MSFVLDRFLKVGDCELSHVGLVKFPHQAFLFHDAYMMRTKEPMSELISMLSKTLQSLLTTDLKVTITPA